MGDDGATWLHIGAGSFHRAHQAWYLHRLIVSGDDGWGIALANIRDDSVPMMKKLAAQDNRYTLETVDPAGNRAYELITSIRNVVPWDADLAALVSWGAAEKTKVISFTVTESGYYLDTALKLDRGNADLQADLAGAKTTIYGAVHAILRERMARGAGPATFLSCDNVRHNGTRFRDGMMEFLLLRGDDEARQWFEANAACPCCMVDRITPRPGPDVAERVLKATGFADQVPVMAESFIQWVVEDDFRAGRPALENVGVEMVADVQPYEEAKIRILNSSHAAIAWAGTLAGLSYIHESTLTPWIRDIAYRYVTDDVIPCLTPCPLDLAAYRDTVLDRFANANILDTNQRVAADGFSKIPAMIMPTVRECRARGVRPDATAMLPALFFVYLRRWRAGALPYAYEDGIMDAARVRAMMDGADPLGAFAADAGLFGEMAGDEWLVDLLRGAVARVDALVKN